MADPLVDAATPRRQYFSSLAMPLFPTAQAAQSGGIYSIAGRDRERLVCGHLSAVNIGCVSHSELQAQQKTRNQIMQSEEELL